MHRNTSTRARSHSHQGNTTNSRSQKSPIPPPKPYITPQSTPSTTRPRRPQPRSAPHDSESIHRSPRNPKPPTEQKSLSRKTSKSTDQTVSAPRETKNRSEDREGGIGSHLPPRSVGDCRRRGDAQGQGGWGGGGGFVGGDFSGGTKRGWDWRSPSGNGPAKTLTSTMSSRFGPTCNPRQFFFSFPFPFFPTLYSGIVALALKIMTCVGSLTCRPQASCRISFSILTSFVGVLL